MKRFIKKLFISFGCASGLFEALRRGYVKNGYVPILLYHRILKNPACLNGPLSCFSLLGIGIPEGLFEKQLVYLKKRYRLISLSDYIRLKEKKEPLSGCAVVTFDDGFKDSGQDLLKKYGIPATVFLIAGSFGKIFWRHEVFFILDEARILKAVFRLPSGQALHLDLSSQEKKRKTLSLILKAFGRMSQATRERYFNELGRCLGVSKDLAPSDIYLTKEEVGELTHCGFTFGAHSQSHGGLRELPDSDLASDIRSSLDCVKKLTGQEDISFAIPFGRYDDRVIAAVKRQGVLCNLTSDNGFDSAKEDNFRLKRLFMNTVTFDEFVYKISGAESLLSRVFSLTRQKA